MICGLPPPAAVTWTATVAVMVPLAPVAVNVYVVFWVGETAIDPDLGSTLPGPGLMLTLVALSTTHISVELWPDWIEAGLAMNCRTRVCAGVEVAIDTLSVADRLSVFFTVRRKL